MCDGQDVRGSSGGVRDVGRDSSVINSSFPYAALKTRASGVPGVPASSLKRNGAERNAFDKLRISFPPFLSFLVRSDSE